MKSTTYNAVKALLEVDRGISHAQTEAILAILEAGSPDQFPGGDLIAASNRSEREPNQGKPTEVKRFLRRHEATRYLGCSVRQLDAMKADGDLPFCYLGRRLIVYRAEDLDAFMQRHRIAFREKRSRHDRQSDSACS